MRKKLEDTPNPKPSTSTKASKTPKASKTSKETKKKNAKNVMVLDEEENYNDYEDDIRDRVRFIQNATNHLNAEVEAEHVITSHPMVVRNSTY